MVRPRFSVIIPAFNEELYLPRLLDSIDVAKERFGGSPGSIEVVLADNLSTDLTAMIAEGRGCKVTSVTKRAIAAARNGGAKAATGEIFCFIDADSAIHPDTLISVDDAMKDPRFIGGATGIYFERWSAGIFVTYCLALPIAVLTGMDTGLVFCRREDFELVGGFDEDLLYAEDVKFQWTLKSIGCSRGQQLVRLKNVKALGSTRKFDEYGDWHYFPMAFRGLIGYFFGGNDEMADRYWYKPNR